jgi:hypothetical protein
MAAIQREIISLNERLIDINKGATDATNTFGHYGNTLIQCLTDVRTLAKAINDGATAYTPLVGVLKGQLKYISLMFYLNVICFLFIYLFFSCSNICRCPD